jgi:glycosyltransferase involved in cell wall biosynthesis
MMNIPACNVSELYPSYPTISVMVAKALVSAEFHKLPLTEPLTTGRSNERSLENSSLEFGSASIKAQALKLLHINPGNLFGGVETFLVTTAHQRAMVPEMTPEYVTFFPGRYGDEIQASGAAYLPLSRAKLSRPWTVWQVRRQLQRLIHERQYDAVFYHAPWVQGLFGNCHRSTSAISIAYFHGPPGSSWANKLAWRRRPDGIIAPSAHTMAEVAPHLPRAHQTVINYPITHQMLSSPPIDAAQRLALRTALGATPEDTVILQACRIEAWKGPDLVLQALAKLKELPHWKFWVAGGPQRPLEEELFAKMKRIAESSGIANRVQFLGQRKDVPQLMQSADIYTQGNRGPEGFSLSFLEASYNRLPIVTTRLGGAGEMIDEHTGILLAPREDNQTTQGLASAYASLIEKPSTRQAMGEQARVKAIRLSDTKQQLERLATAVQQARRSRTK